MTVTITARLKDITGVADDSPFRVWQDVTVREGSTANSIVTTRSVQVIPNNGLAVFPMEPGPAVAEIAMRLYRFVVPEHDSELWPLIEGFVAFPPGTADATIAAAVAAYLGANPPSVSGDWNNLVNKPAVIAAGATGSAARTAIGLGNVDNTSDATKPVSAAQAAAIAVVAGEVDTKLDIDNPTATGLLTTPALKVTGSSPAAGQVLTSDTDGDATWQNPATRAAALTVVLGG